MFMLWPHSLLNNNVQDGSGIFHPTIPGARCNIKKTSYQYRKSHCGDKTILRPSYLHNGISYTGKMTSLYWIRAQATWTHSMLTCVCIRAWIIIVLSHYNDVVMSAVASRISSILMVCSAVCSDARWRKYQRSALLAFVRGIHWWLEDSPHKEPVMQKMFPFDDIIMEWLVTTSLTSLIQTTADSFSIGTFGTNFWGMLMKMLQFVKNVPLICVVYKMSPVWFKPQFNENSFGLYQIYVIFMGRSLSPYHHILSKKQKHMRT